MRVELDSLRAENSALKVRVADLEAQLRSNSENSSKPPSSDGPSVPAARSLRRPSKRKPGGQQGHRGQTLEQVSDPDVVIRHEPTCCRGCGSDLTGAAEVDCSRRQVFDIPPIKVHVTEHRIISRRCRCGKTSTGRAPAQAGARWNGGRPRAPQPRWEAIQQPISSTLRSAIGAALRAAPIEPPPRRRR